VDQDIISAVDGVITIELEKINKFVDKRKQKKGKEGGSYQYPHPLKPTIVTGWESGDCGFGIDLCQE